MEGGREASKKENILRVMYLSQFHKVLKKRIIMELFLYDPGASCWGYGNFGFSE